MRVYLEKPLYDINDIEKYFSSVKNRESNIKSVLDIGCGIPTHLFNLEISYGFNKLIGIDKLTEADSIKRSVKFQGTRNYEGLSNFKECYMKHLEILTNDEIIFKKDHPKKIKNYENHFNFDKCPSQIENFEFKDNLYFDIILAINSLDFVEKETAKKIIKNSCEKLKRNGLLILELKHSQNNLILSTSTSKKYLSNLNPFGSFENSKKLIRQDAERSPSSESKLTPINFPLFSNCAR